MITTRPERTRAVRIGSLTIGQGRPVLIAGPCAVEPAYVDHAGAIKAAGADALRACIFKPRTHPDSFRGLGTEALALLAQARRATGLPLVSEVLSPGDAEVLADLVDAFQVGARNMQNVHLLEALGEMGRPVILKRGLSATVDEWVAASEYIRRRGNQDVVLCERGIRTFEPRTRNTLDVSSVVVVRDLTELPVIVDPSHAAGRRDWVPALCRAALAAGADGLLVEVHPDPERAWSDSFQAVDLAACGEISAEVRSGAAPGEVATIDAGRQIIDALDRRLIELLLARRRVSQSVQQLRVTGGGGLLDQDREADIAVRYRQGLGDQGERVAASVLATCRPLPAATPSPR